MKINITVDIDAKELRRLMGLPDVEPFQRELMDEVTAKMKAGLPEYDPLKLFEPYVARSFEAWGAFEKIIKDSMARYGQGSDKGNEG